MKVIKNILKTEMEKSMKQEAKMTYTACGDDCPRCRVSDG